MLLPFVINMRLHLHGFTILEINMLLLLVQRVIPGRGKREGEAPRVVGRQRVYNY